MADKKPWWQRRRLLWPLVALLALTSALLGAILMSRGSWVVVSNRSGEPIETVTIAVCGQTRTFREVATGDSVQFDLAPRGGESEIAIFVEDDTRPLWRGGYIEPSGGYHAVIQLGRNGEVECHISLAWWPQLLRAVSGATN